MKTTDKQIIESLLRALQSLSLQNKGQICWCGKDGQIQRDHSVECREATEATYEAKRRLLASGI